MPIGVEYIEKQLVYVRVIEFAWWEADAVNNQ
jgi:hypothetical protein